MTAKRPLLVGLLLFLSLQCLFGQFASSDDLKLAHRRYYQASRENVFLHLNKNVFIPGERIWFKAYVLDQNSQKPSLSAANLYVGLYDESGKQLKQKMFRLEAGKTFGEFRIDSLVQGKYAFIKAETKWMKNFNDTKGYVERIDILRTNPISPFSEKDSLPIQLQVFPESGKIVVNTENTIGLMLQSNGHKRADWPKINLLDADKKMVLEHIAINDLGQAKLNYYQKDAAPYILGLLWPNGELSYQELPKPVESGISWSVSNLDSASFLVRIRPNPATIGKAGTSRYYLSVHQNELLKLEEFSMTDTILDLRVMKNTLRPGVNTVSLFDAAHNNLANRLIYNDNNRNRAHPVISGKFNESRDTIVLKTSISSASDENFSLSISALPMATQSYIPSHSIKTFFSLSPYTDSGSGFQQWLPEKPGRRELLKLDMWLMGSGYASGKWHRIQSEFPVLKFPREEGIRLKGHVPRADLSREKTLWFYPDDFEYITFADLQKDKSFQTEMILFNNDSLRVMISNEKGRMRNPELELEIGPHHYVDRLDPEEMKPLKRHGNKLLESTVLPPVFIEDRIIALDEVVLVEKKFETNLTLQGDVEARIITDQDIKLRPTVAHYLRRLGYKTQVDQGSLRIISARRDDRGNYRIVPVFIDGVFAEPSMLFNMSMVRVASLVYDSSKWKYISINSRRDHYQYPSQRKQIPVFEITDGYSRPGNYDQPNYSFLSNTLYNAFGAINWNPELRVDNKTFATYKIPWSGEKELRLFIEGMGSEGSLISTSRIVRAGETVSVEE